MPLRCHSTVQKHGLHQPHAPKQTGGLRKTPSHCRPPSWEHVIIVRLGRHHTSWCHPASLDYALETYMILELADIRIQPGKQAEFDEAIQRGLAQTISKARGYLGHKVQKGIESPERYLLMVYWATLENHTVDFRESPAFTEWRGIVGPFFAGAPQVEHFALLTESA
jgi:heme-degrading monooxygenase HmoA